MKDNFDFDSINMNYWERNSKWLVPLLVVFFLLATLFIVNEIMPDFKIVPDWVIYTVSCVGLISAGIFCRFTNTISAKIFEGVIIIFAISYAVWSFFK